MERNVEYEKIEEQRIGSEVPLRERQEPRSKRSELSEQSPEEVKENVRDKVRKGVASVAGAVEGFLQEMREDDLPKKTREALEKLGETTRELTHTTKQESRKVREDLGKGSERQGGREAYAKKASEKPLRSSPRRLEHEPPEAGLEEEPGPGRSV